MDDLLPEFLAETNEALAELDVALVRLETAPGDQATLSLIFRLVHTIKGTCGFLSLPRLEHVAHAAENVLGRVRDGELVATPPVISLVLAALDRIKAIVATLGSTGAEPDADDAGLIGELNGVASGQPMRAPAGGLPLQAMALAGPAPSPTTPTILPPAQAKTPPGHPAEAPAGPDAGVQTIRVAVDVLEDLMTLVGELVLTRNQLLQLARVEAAAHRAAGPFSAPLQRLYKITSDLQDGVMKTRMQPIGNAWNKLPRLVRDLAHETGKTIVLEMRGQDTELDRQVLELMRDPLTHMVRNSADHGLEPPGLRRAAGKPEAGRILLHAYHEGGHIIIEISDDGRGMDVARIRAKALSQGLATEAALSAMTQTQICAFIFRAGFSTVDTVTALSGRGVGMDVVRANIEQIGGTVELSTTLGAGSCFTIKIPLTLAIVSAVIVEAAGERFAIPQIAVRELVRIDGTQPSVGPCGTQPSVGPCGTQPSVGPCGTQPSARPCGTQPSVGPCGTQPSVGPCGTQPSARPCGTLAGAPGGAEPRHAVTIEQVGGTAVLRLREELLPLARLSSLLRLDQADRPHKEATTVVVLSAGSAKLGIVVDAVFDTEEIVVKPVAPILRHVTMFGGNTILGDGSVIMILDPNGVARAAGIVARSGSETAAGAPPVPSGSEEEVALLLFRAGQDRGVHAVPLNLVARLETIAAGRIERSSGGLVTQYRGQLMKLICMQDAVGLQAAQPVLVFSDGPRSMGLLVDSIIDVVHARLHIELGAGRPGILGTAIIAGQAADVLDTGHWLTLAWRDWFVAVPPKGGRRHVLVVEDSDFFRQLLVPALSASGFDVTATGSGAAALGLRDGGLMVDAIVSDIEMPDMDGIAFARAVHRGGPWSGVPMVALSAHEGPSGNADALAAGFAAYVRKSQRGLLIETLRDCLAKPAGSPAPAGTAA